MEFVDKAIYYFNIYVAYVENLSSTEIWLIVALAAVLMIFIAYRWMGLGAVIALCIIFSIAYILYMADIFNFYEQQELEKVQRNKVLQEELDKK